MSYDATDPFAGGDAAPSLSFKDAPHGTTYTGTVVAPAKLLQSRDFETGEPAFWDALKTQPKWAAVVNMTVGGEEVSVWAAKPSAMYAAIKDAQEKVGQRIDTGGTLTITYTHDVPNKTNPRLNPAKQYSAVYKPADAFASSPDDTPAPAATDPVETAKQLIKAGLPDNIIHGTTGLDGIAIAALRNQQSSAPPF